MSINSIFFVGPLPPPTNGFSEISRRMLDFLSLKNSVRIFDVAPSVTLYAVIFKWCCFVFFLVKKKPFSLYLAFSGGRRQWIDLCFILVAWLRGVRVFVHHHSFSYLDANNLSLVLKLGIFKHVIHIVLCDCMRDDLARQYGINLSNIRVLSNSAFFDDALSIDRTELRSSRLQVGFLSNISFEKGIFEFFSVLNSAVLAGVTMDGVIAGPVDSAISKSFARNLASSSGIRYVGSVYGGDKESFFASIDVLFFPTRYPNEAEPVTILEALSFGIPIIAFDRGCIRGMVSESAGTVFTYSAVFVEHALAALRPLAESPAKLANAKLAARASFDASRFVNQVRLGELVAEMGG